jgi:hypothetical protein
MGMAVRFFSMAIAADEWQHPTRKRESPKATIFL